MNQATRSLDPRELQESRQSRFLGIDGRRKGLSQSSLIAVFSTRAGDLHSIDSGSHSCFRRAQRALHAARTPRPNSRHSFKHKDNEDWEWLFRLALPLALRLPDAGPRGKCGDHDDRTAT